MSEFKDPATMTSEERVAKWEEYRDRMAAGLMVTPEEMRHAISCIAADRAGNMREKKASTAAAKKASLAPISLDEI